MWEKLNYHAQYSDIQGSQERGHRLPTQGDPNADGGEGGRLPTRVHSPNDEACGLQGFVSSGPCCK